jgi:general secretion pathway protein J
VLHNRAYMQAEDNRVTLVRLVMTENQATRLQVVSYRINDGVLTRRESAATRELLQLDTMWQAALGDTDAGATVALQSNVQAMTTRFWIPGATSASAGGWRAANGVSTVATSGVIATLPTGLEVSLTLRSQSDSMVKSFLLGPL